MSSNDENEVAATGRSPEPGPWDPALAKLSEWDPAWAATCVKMSMNPWVNGALAHKFIELVGVGLNAACTNLNPDGTRRHIRAALKAGATREEILFVLKCAAVMSIHSCSLGAPILLEEANAAGVKPATKGTASTPACDKMKAMGQWNTAWDPFVELDPVWTDAFMATGGGIYASGVMSPKEVELLSIAFDASYTHMYAPGHAPSHQSGPESRRDNGRDHGGTEALRGPGRAGLQSRRADPGRGAGMRRQQRQRFVDSGDVMAADVLNRGRSIRSRWKPTNATARLVTCWLRLSHRSVCITSTADVPGLVRP